MVVTCPECGKRYRIDESRVPGEGARLKCTRCQNAFVVKPAQESHVKDPSEPENPILPGLHSDLEQPEKTVIDDGTYSDGLNDEISLSVDDLITEEPAPELDELKVSHGGEQREDQRKQIDESEISETIAQSYQAPIDLGDESTSLTGEVSDVGPTAIGQQVKTDDATPLHYQPSANPERRLEQFAVLEKTPTKPRGALFSFRRLFIRLGVVFLLLVGVALFFNVKENSNPFLSKTFQKISSLLNFGKDTTLSDPVLSKMVFLNHFLTKESLIESVNQFEQYQASDTNKSEVLMARLYGERAFTAILHDVHFRKVGALENAAELASLALSYKSDAPLALISLAMALTVKNPARVKGIKQRLATHSDSSQLVQARGFYLEALLHKQRNKFINAIESARKAYELDESFLPALSLTAECYRHLNDFIKSREWQDHLESGRNKLQKDHSYLQAFILPEIATKKKVAEMLAQGKDIASKPTTDPTIKKESGSTKQAKKRVQLKPKAKKKARTRVSKKKKALKPKLPKQKKSPYLKYIAAGKTNFDKAYYAEALADFKKAIRFNKARDPEVYTLLGQTWMKLYRPDEAYRNFKLAIRMDSKFALAHKGLAQVYDKLGDKTKAIREYSLYLQINPRATDADSIRQRITEISQ